MNDLDHWVARIIGAVIGFFIWDLIKLWWSKR